MQLVDREQAEHVDAALQTMKESLQVLREPSQVIIMTTQMTISESFSANLMTQKLVRKACQSIKAWSCSAPDLDIECLSDEVCKPVEKSVKSVQHFSLITNVTFAMSMMISKSDG